MIVLKKFFKAYKNIAKALKILNELCPEKIKLYEFSEFHIIQTELITNST